MQNKNENLIYIVNTYSRSEDYHFQNNVNPGEPSFYETLNDYLIPKIKRYATRVNADIVEDTKPCNLDIFKDVQITPWNDSCVLKKCLFFEWASKQPYKKILHMDTDIEIVNRADNIFELDTQFSMLPVWNSPQWLAQIKHAMNVDLPPETLAYNGGVIIITPQIAGEIAQTMLDYIDRDMFTREAPRLNTGTGNGMVSLYDMHYMAMAFSKTGCIPDNLDAVWNKNWKKITTDTNFIHYASKGKQYITQKYCDIINAIRSNNASYA